MRKEGRKLSSLSISCVSIKNLQSAFERRTLSHPVLILPKEEAACTNDEIGRETTLPNNKKNTNLQLGPVSLSVLTSSLQLISNY